MAVIFCQTEERKDDVRLFSPKCNRSSLHVWGRRFVPHNHNAKFECLAKSSNETLYGVFSTAKTHTYITMLFHLRSSKICAHRVMFDLRQHLFSVHAKYKYLLSCDILSSYTPHSLAHSKKSQREYRCLVSLLLSRSLEITARCFLGSFATFPNKKMMVFEMMSAPGLCVGNQMELKKDVWRLRMT
jgi:hypothetical protein